MNQVHQANQRLFDEALKHIRAQRKQALQGDIAVGMCVYRSADGLKCAFGPAIRDYNVDMEGSSASEIIHDWPDSLHEWAQPASGYLADRIQGAHDSQRGFTGDRFVHMFEQGMKTIAEDYNLTYTPA